LISYLTDGVNVVTDFIVEVLKAQATL